MSFTEVFGRSATMGDVITPPENPWLRKVSAAKLALPPGVRILRNSSDEPAPFDRHVRLRVATARLRDFMDME